ncbi:MAG: phosphoenolpyruvate--protein phosphotransferase [Desulfococcaceae bacterium]
MADKENREIVLKGIAAAPGICIGKAYLVYREGVNVIRQYHISDAELEDEKKRFKTAVKKSTEELRGIIEDTPEDFREHAAILETHVALLRDKMLYGKAIEQIETEKINAEWALRNVISDLKAKFSKMTDPYFRERSADIVHVSDRIMRNLTGKEHVNIRAIDKRVILVATDLSPAETSQIQLERIKGFVTEGGGMTSHTGIIARTLQIPAVLGINNATGIIRNDEIIVVDGTDGTLIVNPSDYTLVEYEERKSRYERQKAMITRASQLSADTKDGVTVQVMGNIELPEEVFLVRDHGGNGIGLYRTEFQYMNRSGFPAEDELFDKYRDVVEIMAPHPVTIRTLDINGDKTASYTGTFDEANPAMGLRAIRYCLTRPDIFKTQLKAIMRAAAFGNVRILFPMISGRSEVLEAKKMMSQAADCLAEEGKTFRADIETGIMVEVPSAAVTADILAEDADFFSIGTNDLIQYTLAIDRGNRYVSHLYQPLHPAVLRLIRKVTDAALKKGIRVSMCGEMAGDPAYIPVLLGMGITEFSMTPQSIPAVKNAIRLLHMGETADFAKKILCKTTDSEAEAFLKETYGHIAEQIWMG